MFPPAVCLCMKNMRENIKNLMSHRVYNFKLQSIYGTYIKSNFNIFSGLFRLISERTGPIWTGLLQADS